MNTLITSAIKPSINAQITLVSSNIIVIAIMAITFRAFEVSPFSLFGCIEMTLLFLCQVLAHINGNSNKDNAALDNVLNIPGNAEPLQGDADYL